MTRYINGLARQLEFRVLLAWLSLAGALWSFLTIGSEVIEGEARQLDDRLILLLRNGSDPESPLGSPWMQSAMRDITAFGGFTFLVLFSITFALCLTFHRKRREAITFIAIALSAQVSIEAFKALYDRPRPNQLIHMAQAYSASFPSGHTTESTAIFLTAATICSSLNIQIRVKVLAYIVATIAILGVGVSRAYLGVHWPTDVIAGWFLGSMWALMGWLIGRKPSLMMP